MRLIDADAYLDSIKPRGISDELWKECKEYKSVMSFPSAQPEIIRCKDCGHWDTTWQNDFAPNYHYCSLVDGTRSGDFYCADAERRTDAD